MRRFAVFAAVIGITAFATCGLTLRWVAGKNVSFAQSSSVFIEPKVFFSPRGGCTEAVVEEINKAQHKILGQAYGFTSKPICKALIEAHNRGVDDELILDQKTCRSTNKEYEKEMEDAHIHVFEDGKHAIAHNKVFVIDDHIVITGSFNFTESAETRNAENLIIIDSPMLAKEYTDNWEKHKNHSTEQ